LTVARTERVIRAIQYLAGASAARLLVEMIKRDGVGIRQEGHRGRDEVAGVTNSIGKAQFVEKAAIRGIAGAGVMFLSAQDKERVAVGIARGTVVAVTDIAGRSIHRPGIQPPIHKNAHLAADGRARNGNMMPGAIHNRGSATESLVGAAPADPESNAAVAQGNSVVTVIAVPKNIAVNNHVAADPPRRRAAPAGGDAAIARRRLQPKLDCKVAAHISRDGRCINPDLDAVNVI